MKTFKDRHQAGHLLAEALKGRAAIDTIILALPRGGVPVAWEIAKSLKIPWDIILVKKIVSPSHPEFAVGAIAEDSRPVWDERSLELIGATAEQLSQFATNARDLLKIKRQKWDSHRRGLAAQGKDIILVDDGIATGQTMLAAIHHLRQSGARKITVAVPVAPLTTANSIRAVADDLVTLITPSHFSSVGEWYNDFDQVTDETVTEYLGSPC